MRRRLLLAKCGFLLGTGAAFTQQPTFPQQPFPQSPSTLPGYAGRPGTLPPLRPSAPGQPASPPGVGVSLGANPVAAPLEMPLPQPENKVAISERDVSLKRVYGGWQLWAGHKLLRDFGDRETDARDTLQVYRDLRPTEWVTIGSQRTVVEYALVNGRPPMTLGNPAGEAGNNPDAPQGRGAGGGFGGPVVTGAGAKSVVPIDLRTVRVEAVRGVWCVRDDQNIHFNFGPVKADAEQTVAVIRRYGFNRIGVVGSPAAPVMSYFFVGADAGLPQAKGVDPGPLGRAALQAQIEGLSRVGIPVPGVGYVGEMVRIDPRKVDVRKDKGEWLVVSGVEVLGRFGASEYAARDAARTIADAGFTEFCKLGSAGITFFLVDEKAPTRVPYHAQGRRFDPATLKVRPHGAKWAVTESNHHLFDCASAEEGETLVRVIKSFGFDQLCHAGTSPKVGVSFLARGQ